MKRSKKFILETLKQCFHNGFKLKQKIEDYEKQIEINETIIGEKLKRSPQDIQQRISALSNIGYNELFEDWITKIENKLFNIGFKEANLEFKYLHEFKHPSHGFSEYKYKSLDECIEVLINIQKKLSLDSTKTDTKSDFSKTEDKITNVLQYKNTYTDFDNGSIWINEKKKKKFSSNSKISKLWRLLLSNKGKMFKYEEIAATLGLNKFHTNPISHTAVIAQTKRNLINKLINLGIKKDVVSSWFGANQGYCLNN